MVRVGCSLFSSTPSAEENAIQGATQLVAERLKSPSTASYPKRAVVAKDSKGHYLIHVVADAQNSFGAHLRSSFLVAVRVTEGDAKNFEYNANGVAVQEASDPPSVQEIALMKQLNDW